MRIFVLANEAQREELESLTVKNNHELIFNSGLPNDEEYKNYDAYFILSSTWASLDFSHFEDKPVFINAVIETLSELNLPLNVSRLNAWPGFLKNKIWELASNRQKDIRIVFDIINRDFIAVKDEPGLVAPRVISMIINEAYFALEGKVSTKEEIDLAMELGTNYPFGPFEWAEKIGLKHIYYLLTKLSEKDERYMVAPLLKKMISDYN
ncbi:MAG: 3-hydroxyacyl-CoA dehydrogenase family protein [Ginsengibacter sp.]